MDEKKRRGNLLLSLTFAFFLACFSFASVETVEAFEAQPPTCKSCGGPTGDSTCYDVSFGEHICISTSWGACGSGGGSCSPE